MKDFRTLDALELQGICKDERVAYNGKIDAIFDIASHRARVHFGEIEAIDVSSATELENEESTTVKRWLCAFGSGNYLLLPVAQSDEKDRLTLEEVYIRQWSPFMNSVGVAKSSKGRKKNRRGRKERKVMLGNERVIRLLSFLLGDDVDPVLNLVESLTEKSESSQRQLTIKTEGGNTWVGGWKELRKRFGESTIREGKTTCLLKSCKKFFEERGTFEIVYLRMWKPKARILKAILVGILRNPRRISEFYTWGLKSLMKLYNVIKDFSKKSTRKYLRHLVSRVVRDKFGFSMSVDLVILVKFDDRIRLVELKKLLDDGIMACDLPVYVRKRTLIKVRIVWVKNPSIGHTLHNQRAFAGHEFSTCVCAGTSHLKVDGTNANDIPRPDIPKRRILLQQEVASGFSNWFNLKGAIPDFIVFDFQACFGVTDDDSDKISLDDVITVKRECEGLVLTPLDRNAGETLVMCPLVYHRAMMESFVMNFGYRMVQECESEVLARVRMEVREEGLSKFARWDGKGRYGVSYVLPKHKDTSRFRPICPTFKEPMVKTGCVVTKALNHLLFQLPVDNHFNLQAVSNLVGRLQRINKKIERGKLGRVESSSYDIKEMFSRLPHEDILDAVSWIVDHYRGKGKSFVRVNTRGRGPSFGKTTGADNWRQLELDDMLKFVRLELKHTYTYATGVLLRQVVASRWGRARAHIWRVPCVPTRNGGEMLNHKQMFLGLEGVLRVG
ncbi:hypothetical protein CBR_g40645 [Chara braunii]|uniref:Uncharacterized protein n=1 Tax=Chara braunii TaxID=69332 RepID=A0A388LU94_CHABU|nr:hypothetical protein CBR_g40645 [Chara braunii]|eukprot:GBG85835.1 hypothetical protein CBR_g40645 [Chara braunii]